MPVGEPGPRSLVDHRHTHYSQAMTRCALLIALAFASSCKKDPPKGDLPPATSWQAPTAPGAATPPAAAPANPHAGMSGNPHGGAMPGQA